MSNNGYLVNSSTLTSDPRELQRLRSQPGHLDAVVAEGSNRFLIPWLLCFRQGDVRYVATPSGPLPLPCTTVEQAAQNLEASLPVFEAIAGNAALARPYGALACKLVRRLPMPYLTMVISELVEEGGDPPQELAERIMGALSGDASAIPHLKALAEYRDGVAPYPLDVLYGVGGGIDRYGDRTWNATVLDGGFQPDFKYVTWNKAEETPAPATPPPLDDSEFGALRGVQQLAGGWAREVSRLANAWLTLVPESPEGLALHVYGRGEADTATLQASASLASRLDTLARERLEPWCARHGFAWKGILMSAPAPARR